MRQGRRYIQAKWQLKEGILEPTVFELGERGKGGVKIAVVGEDLRREVGRIEDIVPEELLRKSLDLPGLTEPQVARHFNHLAQMNYGVDSGPYWLGSCTMKYTPKVVMKLESHDAIKNLHPYAPDEYVQGILEILYELQEMLSSVTGLPKFSLQPAAGAHGELTGALIIRKRFLDLSERRDEILIPESAHGSNFTSAVMAGFKVVRIPPSDEGTVDMGALRAAVNEKTAGMMITNPNTLGIFESDILEIADILHSNGSYLYYDGANLNAIMGWVRLSDMGVDLAHLNIHKTFSAPHGGGGPGAGAIGVIEELAQYLPVPIVVKEGDAYRLKYDLPKSVGKVRMFHGNVGVLVKAWGYLKLLGSEGIRLSSGIAVLNANYARKKLMEMGFEVPYGKNRPCKHEFVISLANFRKETGVIALDFAKALIDKGVHPPTMYFPTIVPEAFMMEPTESDSLSELDAYINAMRELGELAREEPEKLTKAPNNASITRIDESFANRRLWLSWKIYEEGDERQD